MTKMKKPGYDVGYGKPPKNTQFQPGKSGNPGGRPPGSTSFATAVQSGGERVVTPIVDGKPTPMTIRDATIHGLWNMAVKGDLKAVELVAKHDVAPPLQETSEYPEIVEVKLVLEEEPPHIRAAREEFERENPNFDRIREMREWGLTLPESYTQSYSQSKSEGGDSGND